MYVFLFLYRQTDGTVVESVIDVGGYMINDSCISRIRFSSNFHQNAILRLLLPGRGRQKEKLIFILATRGNFGNYFGESKYYRGKSDEYGCC